MLDPRALRDRLERIATRDVRLRVAGVGVVGVLAAPAAGWAQSAPPVQPGQRSQHGLTACPPPPGEHMCHPRGVTTELWVYGRGTVDADGRAWTVDGETHPLWECSYSDHHFCLPVPGQLIVRVPSAFPWDGFPACPKEWRTDQPRCHPRCTRTATGERSCDAHTVVYVLPGQQPYGPLATCPPPPDATACALPGLPGWVEVYGSPPDRSPPAPYFDVDLEHFSFRFAGGAIGYTAAGASREWAGTFEATTGMALAFGWVHGVGKSFHVQPELGYAHDWGEGYGGHGFLTGLALGLGGRNDVWISYAPRLSLGSRDGFAYGLRHGVRVGRSALQLEAQHQLLKTPDGTSNHVGALLMLDLGAFYFALGRSVSGRPLYVGDAPCIAPLTRSTAWSA